MVSRLWTPPRDLIVPKLPSYVALDMAFGVGSGTTLFDKSRYRSHGTISGASWATGVHGYALDFNPNTPDYVEIPASHTQLDFTSEDFSVIARINIDDLSANRWVFVRGQTAFTGWLFFVRSTGTIEFRTTQTGAWQTTVSTAGDITTGSNFTIGFSRSEASAKVYKNGVDVSSVLGVHINPATCSDAAKVGIHNDKVSYPYDGKIEFMRVLGGIALTASEHLAYHNALK